MLGNRAIYHDGWVACTTPPLPPWHLVPGRQPDVITGYQWELDNTDKDFSQADNLAAPDIRRSSRMLQLQFYTEAARYNVLPLDNKQDVASRPGHPAQFDNGAGRHSPSLRGQSPHPPRGRAPTIKNKSWSITAEVTLKDDASGMIVTQGGRLQRLGTVPGEGQAGVPLQSPRP